jgi:hypothetical protein
MIIQFDTKGNEKQKECCKAWIDNNISDIVYGGSKGSAKSFTGCSLIFGDAFIYPNTHYFIARENLNDLRKFTIPSIYEVFKLWGINSKMYSYNGMDNYFTLNNGSKVFLLSGQYLPSDPEYYRFGSMQNTRGWIEEAGQFNEEAKNNLFASVGRWNNEKYKINGKILQTCNPSKNYLYRDYYLPNKNGTIENWKRFIQAFPQDNKMLDAGYLDNLNRSLNKNQKERLLKGNWEYDDDPSVLCDYENIISMFSNTQIKQSKEKYITADIARMGSDKAIIAVWQGWEIIEFVIFEISKTTDIQQAINTLSSKHNIPKFKIIADEDGVGGGVVDNLGIKGFINNSKALNGDNYFNLQSQCGYMLAEIINTFQLYISADLSDKHKQEIIEDIEQLKTYKSDSDTKLRILPKEQIKQILGRSPDWRDVLLMRAYFDLHKNYGKYATIKI